MADDTSTFMELTASIVSAYVKRNAVASAELPALIGQVHTHSRAYRAGTARRSATCSGP
jgi:predicted transcriptional regulator